MAKKYKWQNLNAPERLDHRTIEATEEVMKTDVRKFTFAGIEAEIKSLRDQIEGRRKRITELETELKEAKKALGVE